MHQSSTWKLLTLVGIIVVGCMVILQVQKGLPVNGQPPAATALDDLSDTTEKFDFDFGDDPGITSEAPIAQTSYADNRSDDVAKYDLPGNQREPDFDTPADDFQFDDPPARNEFASNEPIYSNSSSNPFDGESEPAPTPVDLPQRGASSHGFSSDPGQVSLGSVDDDIVFDDEAPAVKPSDDAPSFDDTQFAPEPTQKMSGMFFGEETTDPPPASTNQTNSNPKPAAVADTFGDFLDDTVDDVKEVTRNAASSVDDFDDGLLGGNQFARESIPLEPDSGSAFDDGFLDSPAAVPGRRNSSAASASRRNLDSGRQSDQYLPQNRNAFPLTDDQPLPRSNRTAPATYREEGNRVISQATVGAGRNSGFPQRSAVRQTSMSQSPNGKLVGSGTVSRDVANSSLRPQLQINKLMPKNASLGKALIYQIVVTNIGNGPAREVVVEDQVPRGCELHGTIPQAQLGVERKDKLVWNLGTLQPKEEQKISVRVVPTAEGQIGSVATVNFAADVSSQTTITAPKLNIHLMGPKDVMIGDPVVYKYTLTNEGTGEATNVIIRSLIPDGLEHPDGNDLEYSVGNLMPGKSKQIVLKLAAVKPGDLVNSAVVTADGVKEEELQTKVTVIGRQLLVTRRGPKRRYIGREGTYENVVRNESRRAAVDAVVLENIPAGMKYVSSNGNGQYNQSRRQVAWRISRLNPGEETKLQVTLLPTDSGEQVSVVQVMEQTGLKSQAKTRTDVEHLMTMGLDISEVDAPVAIGDKMRFTIRARNRGTAATHNVKLALEIPAELKVLSAAGPTSDEGPTKAVPISETEIMYESVRSIPAGESRDFTLTIQATQIANGRTEADVRLRARIQSDEMPKILQTERAIKIYTDR